MFFCYKAPNGKKYRKKVQKVAKSILKTAQKVVKILTIYLFYDNNIINGGDKMVRLFEKKLLNWKESGMKKPLMVIRSKTDWKNIYN